MSLLFTLVVLCFLLFILAVADNYSPLITNGSCYFKAGEQMADEYSPCGNGALSNYWCCQLGDACASENACFNFGTGTTYLAGCTDSSYEDAVCPDKGLYSDQQWTGLVRCYVSDDHSEEEELWATCEDDEQPLVVASNLSRSCQCDKNNPDFTTAVVFTAGPGLVNYATLPEQKEKSIMWAAGMTPSTFEFAGTATSGSMPLSSQPQSSAITSSPSVFPGNLSSTAAPTSLFSPVEPDPTSTSTLDIAPKTNRLSTDAIVGIVFGTSTAMVACILFGIGARKDWIARRRLESSDRLSQICCCSGSRCNSNAGAAEPMSEYVAPHRNKNDTLNSRSRNEALRGNMVRSEIRTNFGHPRSLWMDGREDPDLSCPGSNGYVRGGNHTFSQSPSSPAESDANERRFQPYRPNYSAPQCQLHEIAELSTYEKPLMEDASPRSHYHSANNSDQGRQLFTPERDTSVSYRPSDLTKLSPTRPPMTMKHEIHELPG